MNGGIQNTSLLISQSPEVWIAAALLLVGALWTYLGWFSPRVEALQETLIRLTDALNTPGDGWSSVRDSARKASETHGVVKSAWGETEERVIHLPVGERSMYVMFGAPRDIWSGSSLLSRSMNLGLAEAVPNLLVGIGLLLTFFFLTQALVSVLPALDPQAGAQVSTQAAVFDLLKAAGAKFVTSLAGLLASVLWAIFLRRRISRLNLYAERVLDQLTRLVRSGGGELAMYSQLRALQDLGQAAANVSQSVRSQVQFAELGIGKAVQQIGLTDQLLQETRHHVHNFQGFGQSIFQFAGDIRQVSQEHLSSTKSIEAKAGEQLPMLEEMLNEAREQTGTFKRFETDLAVSLAGAITQAFSPHMEVMTNRLIAAIDGLSNKLGSMNQEALEQMLKDFGGQLKQATSSEMDQLRTTLQELSDRLSKVSLEIGTSAGKAAKDLTDAGAGLSENFGAVAGNLSEASLNLGAATRGLSAAMTGLDSTVVEAATLGRQGAAFVTGALQTSDKVFSRLQTTSQDLGQAVLAIDKAAGVLAEAVDSVEEVAREQKATALVVKEAVPEAAAAVQKVTDLLQNSVRETALTMEQVKSSMASTADTLGKTVAQITTGVTEYSATVAELHRTMDEKMAQAIGSLDKSVEDLSEATEELSETLSGLASRK
jgi:methyl-accepting chemotaxis protein